MMHGFGWAKNPVIKRVDRLDDEIPITMLYGSRSWMESSPGEFIKQSRTSSFVNLQVICLIQNIKKKIHILSTVLKDKEKIFTLDQNIHGSCDRPVKLVTKAPILLTSKA